MTCADPTPGTLTLTGAAAGVDAAIFADAFGIKTPACYNWEWTNILTSKGPGGTYGGGCARNRKYQRVAGEVWVWAKLYAGRINVASGDTGLCLPPPMPTHPDGSHDLTLKLGAATADEEITDPSTGQVILTRALGADDYHDTRGNLYIPLSLLVVFEGSRCRENTQDPTGGGITFTQLIDPYTWTEGNPSPTGEVDGALVSGRLNDVTFPDGSAVSGAFVAPFCSMQGCPARPSKPACVS